MKHGDGDLSIYNLDNYDDEEEEVQNFDRLFNDDLEGDIEEDDLSDIDDITIRPTDAILLGVHTEVR